ncbi:hypothetical protein [Sutcliffiella rhizosphaerae]|uniref:Uncharacterized protein n=1 Tax=Sutcliffiella rhizosphaerae TaxID=2880967 RepID=A0ABN8AK87_9BACI|nr:hypothetical protein [Sutcliffiella rhizosphaerae]CAG9623573.1 hypothetical protein BACCIP111883_04391 [Sutcliffiella rhizosphaerae]
MLRYYRYVTRLGENFIEESEEVLRKKTNKAKKIYKLIRRRLDELEE